MKNTFLLIGLFSFAAQLGAQITLSYSGGTSDGGFGQVRNNAGEASANGNSIGFFVVNDESFITNASNGLSTGYFNQSVMDDTIEIFETSTITDLGGVREGSFFGSVELDLSFAGKQIYAFSTNGPLTDGFDWNFTEIGIWSSAEWIIPSGEGLDMTFSFDLGGLSPEETVWGSSIAVNSVEAGAGYAAIMAPAIPEPSAYALMMMGVALGYTVYRRRRNG